MNAIGKNDKKVNKYVNNQNLDHPANKGFNRIVIHDNNTIAPEHIVNINNCSEMLLKKS